MGALWRSEVQGTPARGGVPGRLGPTLVVDAGGATGVIDLFRERGLTRLGRA